MVFVFPFTASEVVIMLMAIGSCGAGLLYACFQGCRQSRCNKINLLCCGCEREVQSKEEFALDLASRPPKPQTPALPPNGKAPI